MEAIVTHPDQAATRHRRLQRQEHAEASRMLTHGDISTVQNGSSAIGACIVGATVAGHRLSMSGKNRGQQRRRERLLRRPACLRFVGNASGPATGGFPRTGYFHFGCSWATRTCILGRIYSLRASPRGRSTWSKRTKRLLLPTASVRRVKATSPPFCGVGPERVPCQDKRSSLSRWSN